MDINKSKAQKILADKNRASIFLRWKQGCRDIHGLLYSYKDVIYKTDRDKVILNCKKHGQFEIQPRHHKRGQICAKCKHEERGNSQRKTTDQFIKESEKIYSKRFNYSKTIYTTSREKVTIICPEHGEFQTTPRNHIDIRKSITGGCKSCAKAKGYRDDLPAKFYFFRFKDTNIYKIGISNKELNQRYPTWVINKIERIVIRDFKNGFEARQLESLLKKKLIKYKYKGILLPDGNTELFESNKIPLLVINHIAKG